MMLALGIVLLVVGVVALAVIRIRWQRWGFEQEYAKLENATEDLKVEFGKAFLPVIDRLQRTLEKVSR